MQATAAALLRTGSVVSHRSAAVVHGLPLLGEAGRPELTTTAAARTCARPSVRVHVAALDAEEIIEWYGVPVTCPSRTIADLARSRGVRDGLVAADAALHERLVDRPALALAAARCAGWPGARSARRVAELASSLAESPLESLTRLCLLEAGVPSPELQVWIRAAGRRYRVDMLWRTERVLLEADGEVKYSGPRALWSEKRRQEHLERAGYRVVRVIWDDVEHHPKQMVARVRAALAAPYGLH